MRIIKNVQPPTGLSRLLFRSRPYSRRLSEPDTRRNYRCSSIELTAPPARPAVGVRGCV
jgi:hypothetical protein